MNATAFPFADWILLAIFAVFVGSTVAGALIAVNTIRIIRSVCGLAMACIGLAGLFYFLNSPFLALMEILIYVGAVCVTIIFAVMLAEHDEPVEDRLRRPYPLIGFMTALLIAGGVFYGVARISLGSVWPRPGLSGEVSVAEIGTQLLTTYSLAFELISLVLLVSILGALVIAHNGRKRN
jgi:NADH-quinone oxidoreductase subunit J